MSSTAGRAEAVGKEHKQEKCAMNTIHERKDTDGNELEVGRDYAVFNPEIPNIEDPMLGPLVTYMGDGVFEYEDGVKCTTPATHAMRQM